jgi:flavin-dependent dehydrogenase
VSAVRRGATAALDVLVVGGGPAGLATAIACRERGLTVRVLDPRRPPLDKACGEGVMPDGVRRLRGWGIEPPGVRFAGIRFIEGATAVAADFPSGRGLAVRRVELHDALAAAAAARGAELSWGMRADGVDPDAATVATAAATLTARYVVAADGLRSPARRGLGLEAAPAPRRRYGVRRHFALAPWTRHVEVHWTDGAEAYVTPLADQVGVAILWSGDAAGAAGEGTAARGGTVPGHAFDRLLARFPALAERLAGATASSSDRGAGPFEQRVRGVVRGRAALVGDAAGYVDALTGEGLALAFAEADALADALARDDLPAYAAASRRLRRVPELVTSALLLVERRPRLRRRLLRALGDPRLFTDLLALLTGAGRPAVAAVAWRLGLRLALP